RARQLQIHRDPAPAAALVATCREPAVDLLVGVTEQRALEALGAVAPAGRAMRAPQQVERRDPPCLLGGRRVHAYRLALNPVDDPQAARERDAHEPIVVGVELVFRPGLHRDRLAPGAHRIELGGHRAIQRPIDTPREDAAPAQLQAERRAAQELAAALLLL